MGLYFVDRRDGTAGFYDQSTGKPIGSFGGALKGTAGTGFSAEEFGDGVYNVTKLTVAYTLPAIAGGAALGVGRLAYTFPSAPALHVVAARINVGITQTQANINTDTPVLGLGGVVASGAVSVLSGTATFQDIMAGVAVANCTGTKKVNTLALAKYIEPAGTKTVYLNAAGTWSASGDAAAIIAGTIYIEWVAFP